MTMFSSVVRATARYSAEGTLLTKCESPHVADAIGDHKYRLRKMAEEERQSQLDDFSEQVTQFKEQLAAIEKRLKKFFRRHETC